MCDWDVFNVARFLVAEAGCNNRDFRFRSALTLPLVSTRLLRIIRYELSRTALKSGCKCLAFVSCVEYFSAPRNGVFVAVLVAAIAFEGLKRDTSLVDAFGILGKGAFVVRYL